jgi:hypothetical protein
MTMRYVSASGMGRWGQTAALCATLIFAGLFHASAANAPPLKVLYSFCAQANCADGTDPMGLVEDHQGNLYGTALKGGAYGKGAVYELKHLGEDQYEYLVLYSFCRDRVFCLDGWSPVGPLILDKAGDLYGLTFYGGKSGVGEAFELTTVGHASFLHILYSFCSQSNCMDGEDGIAGLTYAGAGTGQVYDGQSPLYGVTYEGGAKHYGVVFALQPASNTWQEQVLYNFCSLPDCADGGLPLESLVEDGSGNPYGTTLTASKNAGNIFELSPDGPDWTETTLYDFCSLDDCADGFHSSSSLSLDSSGNLYGETSAGGDSCSGHGQLGCGVVFQLTPNGTASRESVVHAFCAGACTDGYSPGGGVVLDSQGDIFGTAEDGGDFTFTPNGGGTIFVLNGNKEQVLYQFCRYAGCTDGSGPSDLIRDPSGYLFGFTASGGAYGNGTVFEFTP